MKRRTKARIPAFTGTVSDPVGMVLGACMVFLAFLQRLWPVAIRTVAATALLSAQISASYANTGDAEEQEPAGRLALVIGNSGYKNVEPLKNPGNDAKLIAETLRGLGFEVIEKTDLTRKSFQAAVDDIAEKAASYETVLVYYAGHGFQIDGNNYLVPVDSKLRDRKKFANETVDLNGIVGKLEGDNRNTLILIDACRNNPVSKDDAATDMPEGLAQMETGSGTFVAFATQPGNITRDGAGENSPFTIALAEHMQTEGISISDMMIRVRNTVEERTAGEQTPWDQSSLRAQFYFNPTVEETDSLTEEDLALLEQLDPALREKFMKRFGLKLNEDGSAETGEVVATVTPSLRIEGDFADPEAGEETVETPAETEEQPETETTLAAAEDGEARTAEQDPAATPRKPGLMILAMPEDEPAATEQAPAFAAAKEEEPKIVALATPEEISPVAQEPAPAPAVPDDATTVQKAEPVTEAETPATPPAADVAAPSEPAVSPGNKTADAPQTAAAPATDAKEAPAANVPLGETAATAVAAAAKSLMQRATDTAKVAANSSIPVPAPAEIASAAASPGEASVVKPGNEARAKPDATPADTAKDTAPAVIAAAPKPATPQPATPALAEIEPAKPETGKTDRAKQATSPQTEIALAKPVSPEPAKPAADTAGQPVAPSLTPSAEPAKAPAPAQVAAAPVASEPAAKDLTEAAKDLAEAPAAPVAAEPVLAAAKPLADSAKPSTAALDKTGIADEPSGPQLTATSPALPNTGTPSTSQNDTGKEQLLAMADPAPATKLAPAATMAAVAPDQTAEPAEGKLAIPLPGDETDEEKKALAIKAQKELTRLGCYRNETDGDWGPRSARALLRFYAEQKLDPDQLEPTAELVNRLTSIDKVICKNTETDRPKQSVKKATSSKPAAKAQPAPAKQKAPVAQKAPTKAKPAAKNAPAVAKAKPAPSKKIDGGALIGAFR